MARWAALLLTQTQVVLCQAAQRSTGSTSSDGGGRKNILFLASDDLRPQLGTYQPEDWAGQHVPMHTPNIDAFANDSMVFLKSYCQQAICMATRASLLTGRRPDTTGVTVALGSYWRTNTAGGGNFTSLPQHFRENGYTTIGHGKIFHPGGCSGGKSQKLPGGGQSTGYTNPGPEVDPKDVRLGDDHPFAWTDDDPDLFPGSGYYHAPNKMFWQCSAAPGYNNTCPAGHPMGNRITPSYLSVNRSLEQATPLMDQQVADQAIKTLVTLTAPPRAGTPWFCAVGFHLPHLPDLVPQRFVDMYPKAHFPDNQYAPADMPNVAWSNSGELRGQYSDARALHSTGAINSTLPPAFTTELRRHYYGAVSYLDYQVGRVLDALNATGQQDNTVRVLWGDHGYQLGEHGIWCKVTNFELATHTVLIMSWPGMGHTGRSKSFVEFVDIMPTLADLGGIPVPPLCPVNSRNVKLCTEGISLRPIFSSPSHQVKKASFSQYPHHASGVAVPTIAGDEVYDAYEETLGDEETLGEARSDCQQGVPGSVLGVWYSRVPTSGKKNNKFVLLSENTTNTAVRLDVSGCHDCSFTSAIGHQTSGDQGVHLTLHFKPPSHEADGMNGTLTSGGCELGWSTNSTTGSAPPHGGGTYMGYTMVTQLDGVEYRYTEWPKWQTVGQVKWTQLAGRELYNHSEDAQENANVVDTPSSANVVVELSRQLRAGWRAALL